MASEKVVKLSTSMGPVWRGAHVKYKGEEWVITGWSVEKRRVWLGRDGASVTLTNDNMLRECGLKWD